VIWGSSVANTRLLSHENGFFYGMRMASFMGSIRLFFGRYRALLRYIVYWNYMVI